ncbi:MAG TPA: glycoside hydrolase family 15 protein [Actinomycetota bacterium]|nr:glycoside hydrolase family 15 protein [Actinomycetota bacterium]
MNRIADYALIGDCHSAALVGLDGSIDWACFPRFDSPSVFARILDARRGGSFRVAAAGAREITRAYEHDTNVLVTTFTSDTGRLELTDFMPVVSAGASIGTLHSIIRRARAIEGVVTVEMTLDPRFEYGSFRPGLRLTSPVSADAIGGADALTLHSTHRLALSGDAVTGSWRLRAGESVWLETSWRPSYRARIEGFDRSASVERSEELLEDTIAFWRNWVSQCRYDGEHAAVVRRSALALKAMTYAPSGAVIAAPTTSLPEEIGGTRNWDYRFTWIRDATLTLTSLFVMGFRTEADQFKRWLERASAGRAEDLQIMFGIGGERYLPEYELLHLDGHRGSAPVRIGNGAFVQTQLDSYGQILEAAYLYGKAGGGLGPENWRFLAALADEACARWRDPDHGVWEIRDTPRHFMHSKLHCWVALDRALRIAKSRGFRAPVARWQREAEAIKAYILSEGAPEGWVQQAAGVSAADAATLLVPAVGMLPSNHPVSLRTVEVVRAQLEKDGLLYRYLTDDGIEGGEGAFLICSFWLLDCLTHAGRLEEADELLDKLLLLGNDVGLFAEQADVVTGEALGNFPQAFSHMALVLSCAYLSAAKNGEIAFDGAADYAELAVDRLLAGRPF